MTWELILYKLLTLTVILLLPKALRSVKEWGPCNGTNKYCLVPVRLFCTLCTHTTNKASQSYAPFLLHTLIKCKLLYASFEFCYKTLTKSLITIIQR